MSRLLLCLAFLMVSLGGFSLLAQTPAPNHYEQSPERRQKAIEYSRKQYQLTFFGMAYGLLQIALVIWLQVAPRFRNLAERVSTRPLVQAFVFAPLFLLVMSLFDTPVTIYQHILALQYEQSIQTWGSWLWDQAKGMALGLFFSTLGVWLLYTIIRRFPTRWWLAFWLISLPIIVLTIWLVPIVIEPLFYKFTPLQKTQPQLVQAISRVVERGGLSIPPERMFEMKASEKLKSVNAYVTGFGSSKRVVVWDTTVQKMTTPETLFVFGHEMGHYVLHHIYEGLVFASLSLLLTLWLAYIGLRWLIGRYGTEWHIRAAGDWASLPLILLISSVFNFIGEPVQNAFTRYQEHEADIYGLEVTHGLIDHPTQTAAHAFQVLGDVNLSDPDPSPLIEFWLFSHPSIPSRIRFAQQYDPWSKGEPRRFVQ